MGIVSLSPRPSAFEPVGAEPGSEPPEPGSDPLAALCPLPLHPRGWEPWELLFLWARSPCSDPAPPGAQPLGVLPCGCAHTLLGKRHLFQSLGKDAAGFLPCSWWPCSGRAPPEAPPHPTCPLCPQVPWPGGICVWTRLWCSSKTPSRWAAPAPGGLSPGLVGTARWLPHWPLHSCHPGARAAVAGPCGHCGCDDWALGHGPLESPLRRHVLGALLCPSSLISLIHHLPRACRVLP